MESLLRSQSMELIVRLTGSVGHEYNNLLQNIMGSLQLVRKLIGAGRAVESERFIETAMRAAQAAGVINQRLVGLARPHAFDPRPIVMNDVVAGVAELLTLARPKTFKLDTELAPDLWSTCCDSRQAEIALISLVLHTFDAKPAHHCVAVRTRNREIEDVDAAAIHLARGPYVCIEVTGIGNSVDQDGTGDEDAAPAIRRAHIEHPPGLTINQLFALQSGGNAAFDWDDRGAISTVLYLPRHAGDASLS